VQTLLSKLKQCLNSDSDTEPFMSHLLNYSGYKFVALRNNSSSDSGSTSGSSGSSSGSIQGVNCSSRSGDILHCRKIHCLLLLTTTAQCCHIEVLRRAILPFLLLTTTAAVLSH
jgi:hypothetical protein